MTFPVSLVVGCGEIGSALGKVLSEQYDVYYVDPGKGMRYELKDPVSVMHICFPYSESFKSDVRTYIKRYNPSYTVVHSTVPVGTCEQLHVYHSPIRGIHPNLEEGIKTFVKYLAPHCTELADYFKRLGIKVYETGRQSTTEALKLWDTTQYGWNIVLEKIIHQWCVEHGVDFDVVYSKANYTYNIGYNELGHPEYKKYCLRHVDGPIGGHCVLPNIELFESPVNDFIRDFNARLEVPKMQSKTRRSR